MGIPEDESDADDGEDHPAEEAVFETREERDAGDALGDADGEGVEDGTRKTHMGGHIAHTETDDGVVTHRDGQRDEDDDKGDGLLAHAEDGPEEAEHQHHKGDDDIFYPYPPEKFVAVEALDAAQEGHHAHVDGMGVVENPEGTADDKDKDDNVGLVDETIEKSREDLPRLGGGLDIMERIVQHHLAPVNHLSLELARGDEPRAYRRQHDEGEDDGKGMGNLFQVES